MWSQILLCLLVGLALASENPGWSPQYHYVYQVRGRSLASLDQISSDYSGIVFKAKLEVQPMSDGKLGAKITDALYAKVHAELKEGWDSKIPDSELNYQELPLSNEPFEIVLNRGAIRNVIVSKKIKNWNANMIKSIVSQLQLDTKAENRIPSSIEILTLDEDSGVFKTMEETVTGVSQTLYGIHPYPEYVLQSIPWPVPLKRLSEGGKVIEVTKIKNFTNSEQIPLYHHGFDGIEGFQPGNKIGKFLSRTAETRAVITGTLKKFTIQSSVTVEEIDLSPTFGDNQKGSHHSKLNLTLLNVAQPLESSQFQVSNPIDVGLVYSYNDVFGTDNSPDPVNPYDHATDPASDESRSEKSSYLRRPRPSENNYAFDSNEVEDWHQDKPQPSEAPPSPLLPFTVGYDGQSFKKQQNIIETVRKVAQEIGQEYPHPKDILHQQTVGKFVTLASLVRIMDLNEIQQVASQLYGSGQEESYAWIAYRDAVAQSGTGPALLALKEWIEGDKISDFEGAQLMATTADAARQPTEEYMKIFNAMIQNEQIMQKPYVNESILLSFTNLLHQVYADSGNSRGKFPVYSYGSFRTVRGKEFVKKTVIPYLTRQLNEAITQTDTVKIHAYIRALGNVGQQQILEAFEPYLEGDKKASHFQRMLMVTALDRLVKSNPRVARSVAYKIYQNPTEAEQVRVAAVYLVMRANPTPAMLQQMALNTNDDPSNYVNAAVKSSIEYAAELEDPEYYQLRSAAQSARPLLNSEEYGAQYSQGYLRKYVEEESEAAYRHNLQTYNGKDHAVPKGIKYFLQRQLGGVRQNILNAQAMVSSVEDLIDVYQQQTKEYQRQQQEKQQEQSVKSEWSSEYLAKLIGLENEQREQLEGNFYLQLGPFHAIASFDNLTLDRLPQAIKEVEEQLRQGQKVQYNKMFIAQESSLAFPTILGLPFLYTYDRPVLIRYEGNVKANAQPHISTGEILQKPDAVEAEFDIQAVISGKIQSQLGIFTPFDHQRYSAGYNKNFQVVVPLEGKLELNVQKQQLKVEVENPGNQENVHLAHYSSWPYTSQNEIYNLKPNIKIIRSKDPYRRNVIVGDKSTGVAVYFQITSDEIIDGASFYEKFTRDGALSALLNPWEDENIQYVHIDVGINSAKSTAEKVILRLGYQSDYEPNNPSEPKPDPYEKVNSIPSFPDDPEKRQSEFVDKLSRYANNVHVLVADATVEFHGQNKFKYSVTAGAAKSNVAPRGVFMAFARKLQGQNPHVLAYIQGASEVPNTNGLNLDYAMQMDPTTTAYVQGLLQTGQRLSKADAHIKLSKNEERVQYLKEQKDYEECKHQMQQGNYQLPICAKATARANFLNQFSIKMKYSDLHPRIVNATYHTYSMLRHSFYSRVEENIVDPQNNDDLEIEGQFSPDLHYVNLSLSSEYGQVEARNVYVNRWARQVLVPHPVFHLRSRLEAQALKDDTYRPICVVDKIQTSTFDNQTYPSPLTQSWSVVLQYVPRRPSPVPNKPELSVPEQLHQHIESYVVYARTSQQGSSQKEIQIVLQMPSTQGKVVKIVMKPGRQGKEPKVLVNDQDVKYTTESSEDFFNGHVQIYALPNQEVKVEVRDAFYVIFDGQVLKLTSVNSKFRDASRGLCGTFTGEPETDFLTPENCIIQSSQQFVQSYTVQPQSRQGRSQKYQGQECYQKIVIPVDYISNQDAGRSSENERRSGGSCTEHLSRYIEKNGEICFTVRPLPRCKSPCRAMGTVSKKIDVVCLSPTSSTAFWRSQLDKGIKHDFTMMEASEKIQMQVPARCAP